MSKEDLIVTRNGIPFEDQAEGLRQFKEAAFNADEKAKAPQDVEEFIALNSIQGEFGECINTSIFRAFIAQREAGHVEYRQIGWTNPAQVSYVKDDSGSVYPNQDHGCDIPVFIPAAKEES